MAKSFVTPAKYVQGSSLLSDAYRYVSHIGRRFAVIADDAVRDLIEMRMKRGFRNAGNQCTFLNFRGESSQQEAMRLADLITEKDYSGVMGAGGGKAIDTAKLVGDMCGLPVVTVPTSASSDAACSCVASIYAEEGRFFKLQKLKEGPVVVLVDTEIISKAPVRLLISGMGNAFSSFYEARACQRSGVLNYTGGSRTHTAFSMTKLCRDLLLEYGKQATKDVQAKSVTRAVEAIVEANIYLSGVGFVNNGCAACHGIYSGMTIGLKNFNAMHGEGIALGVLVQLIMEYSETGKWDKEEWEQTINFYKEVGLPLNFQNVGILQADDPTLLEIAKAACQPGSNIYNMPFEITDLKVYKALRQLRDLDMR